MLAIYESSDLSALTFRKCLSLWAAATRESLELGQCVSLRDGCMPCVLPLFRLCCDGVSTARLCAQSAALRYGVLSSDYKQCASLLFSLELLDFSVCYCEYSNRDRFHKKLATRNADLVFALTGTTPRGYTLDLSDIRGCVIPAYGISLTKTGYVLDKKTLHINTVSCSIMPYSLLEVLADALDTKLSNGLHVVRYLKDDGTVRDLLTTWDADVLSVYPVEFRERFIRERVLHRGYIYVPFYGVSQYDVRCLRAVNLLRLVSVTPSSCFDVPLLNVDVLKLPEQYRCVIRRCVRKTQPIGKTGDYWETLVAVGDILGVDIRDRDFRGLSEFLCDRLAVSLDVSRSILYSLHPLLG